MRELYALAAIAIIVATVHPEFSGSGKNPKNVFPHPGLKLIIGWSGFIGLSARILCLLLPVE
ncbi:hypothetical protein GQ44DRAFT_715623 [Phaeosphaeriaceae sp. PMI808]|nr:hypothetical protein GQ44DRAFT_715623 [Phaeosphaeriaceae sp. PMI808]